MTRRWGLRLFVLLLAAVAASPALAHEARPGYLEIRQTGPETYAVLWKVPARGDLRLALDAVFPPECEETVPRTRERLGGAAIDRWHLRCPDGLDGRVVRIAGLRSTMTDVICRLVRSDGSTETARLSPSAPSVVLGTTPGWTSVARAYLVLGVEHILGGPDHLLFVACLVMLAGWGRRLLITITGFTLAHSVTLALATLGVVEVPIAAVEAVIALSVVFVACEIVRGRRDSLTFRYPVLVSSVFGLLHGFGFAAVLHEIGLPDSAIPTALLFFNVGVEVGQILFVLALAAVIGAGRWIVGRVRSPEAWTGRLGPAMANVAAYAIGGVATFWVIQRLQVVIA
jgi:hydrogenase/urease accessory protein HupE